MKIRIIDDAGNVKTISARVIEPATMTPGKILLDQGERDDSYNLIDLSDVLAITD